MQVQLLWANNPRENTNSLKTNSGHKLYSKVLTIEPNRLINLAPMVQLLAQKEGMAAILISDTTAQGDYYKTDFVIVTRNQKLIQDPRLASAKPIVPIPGLKVWTDDYNNLFDVLR